MNGVFKAVSEAGGDMQKVAPSGFPVLNMLNTRYFIFPLQGGKTVPIQNPYTLGNAWFVNEVQYVDNANEEIDALHRIDPAKTAVVDKKFSAEVKSAVLPQDKELETALFHRLNAKKCAVCGALFTPGSNRAKYCPECAARMKRINAAKRKRKQREKCHALGAEKPL